MNGGRQQSRSCRHSSTSCQASEWDGPSCESWRSTTRGRCTSPSRRVWPRRTALELAGSAPTSALRPPLQPRGRRLAGGVRPCRPGTRTFDPLARTRKNVQDVRLADRCLLDGAVPRLDLTDERGGCRERGSGNGRRGARRRVAGRRRNAAAESFESGRGDEHEASDRSPVVGREVATGPVDAAAGGLCPHRRGVHVPQLECWRGRCLQHIRTGSPGGVRAGAPRWPGVRPRGPRRHEFPLHSPLWS